MLEIFDLKKQMCLAAQNGKIDTIKRFLWFGYDINTSAQFEKGEFTLLECACQTPENIEIVKFLVEKGAKLGNSLHMAAKSGDEDIIRYLILAGTDTTKEMDLYNSSMAHFYVIPLYFSVKTGNLKTAKLLAPQANEKIFLYYKDCVKLAIDKNNIQMLSLLTTTEFLQLKESSFVLIYLFTSKLSEEKKMNMARMLIGKQGFNINNFEKGDLKTAVLPQIFDAAMHDFKQYKNFLLFLIRNGAGLPLSWSLLSSIYDIYHEDESKKQERIFYIIVFLAENLGKEFLRELKNESNENALDLAPFNSELERFLIEGGYFDLNEKDKEGNTYLHKKSSSANTIERLLKNGAKPGIKNKKGENIYTLSPLKTNPLENKKLLSIPYTQDVTHKYAFYQIPPDKKNEVKFIYDYKNSVF